MKEMTVKELAELLFSKREEKEYSVDFFDSRSGDEERGYLYRYCFCISVFQYAAAPVVFCNYYGGGSAFCYDLTDDQDSSGLQSALSFHFKERGIGDVVYVEEKEYPYENEYRYPELDSYDDNIRDLNRPLDDVPIEDIGRYEVVFDISGERFYCYIDATNMNEALGQFFKAHPNISYSMILDHMEV